MYEMDKERKLVRKGQGTVCKHDNAWSYSSAPSFISSLGFMTAVTKVHGLEREQRLIKGSTNDYHSLSF